jgi:glutamyl-tRNA synthetase
VEAYRDMGFLPEAMRNYLARLGWSHGNDEFFTTEQAVAWFDLSHLGKAPARFDFSKLTHLSGQHIRAAEDGALVAEIDAFLASQGAARSGGAARRLLRAMPGMKERAKTIPELLEMGRFLLTDRPVEPDAAAAKLSGCEVARDAGRLISRLQHATWEARVWRRACGSSRSRKGWGSARSPSRCAPR